MSLCCTHNLVYMLASITVLPLPEPPRTITRNVSMTPPSLAIASIVPTMRNADTTLSILEDWSVAKPTGGWISFGAMLTCRSRVMAPNDIVKQTEHRQSVGLRARVSSKFESQNAVSLLRSNSALKQTWLFLPLVSWAMTYRRSSWLSAHCVSRWEGGHAGARKTSSIAILDRGPKLGL